MVYNNYLFQTLNEAYFGKTKEILWLEKAVECHINLCKNPEDEEAIINLYRLQREVNKETYFYFTDIDKFYKENRLRYNIDSKEAFLRNFYRNDYWYEYTDKYKIAFEAKSLMEKIISFLFGFYRVYIYNTSNRSYFDLYNATTVALHQWFLRWKNLSQNTKSTYPNFDYKHEMLWDDCHRKLYFDDIKNSMIRTKYSVKFDPKVYTLTLLIFLPDMLHESDLTPGEVVSTILHEIGHSFSFFIEPNKLSKRVNEKFADKFVSLYGYSAEKISSFRKTLGADMYTIYDQDKDNKYYQKPNGKFDSEKRLKDIDKYHKDKLSNRFVIDRFNLSSEYIYDPYAHPSEYMRCLSLLKQLQLEIKDPNITKEQRIKINHDIYITKKELEKFKNKPYLVKNKEHSDDIHYKMWARKGYKYIVDGHHLDPAERTAEKYDKLDSRLFKGIIDNMPEIEE